MTEPAFPALERIFDYAQRNLRHIFFDDELEQARKDLDHARELLAAVQGARESYSKEGTKNERG